MKKAALLLIIFTNVLLAQAQEKFSKEILNEDFNYYVKLIENTHPDPYSLFGGKMSFNREVQKIKNNLPENGLTKTEFENLLSQFIAQLHDGHTSITRGEGKKNNQAAKMLNLQFKIVTDGMVVSHSKDGKLNGYKLIEVNGIGVDSLLTKVQMLEPCENIYGAYTVLNGLLRNSNNVKRLFAANGDKLKLTLQKTDKKVITSKTVQEEIAYVDKMDVQAAPQWDAIQYPAKRAPFWYSFLDPKNKKVMYFPFYTTYAREVIEMMKKQGWDYASTLSMLYNNFGWGAVPNEYNEAIKNIPSYNETFFAMLTEMKQNKSTHLIIDLRQNVGGWTPITLPSLYMLAGDAYFGYECPAEYNTLISDLYLSTRNMTIDDYNKQQGTNYKVGDYKFGYFMGKNWPADMTLAERREKYLENNFGDGMSGADLLKSTKGEPVYKPTVIVVTSPTTFSAAFHYLYFLREVCNAVIVGVSPQQAYNNGMETTPFTLPNTGIGGSISNSYQLFYPTDMEKGKLLIPDYKFTWADFVKYNNNMDAELMFVLDLIKTKK